MAKTTAWYPPDVQPVRPGVYERDFTSLGYSDVPRFAYWDGELWYGYAQNPHAARRSYDNGFRSGMQTVGWWRGLLRRSSTRK